MYLSDLLRGLLRRWYIIIAGLLITAGAAYGVYTHVPVTYESNATLLLLPPEESLGVEGSNPYLLLGGMGQALAVLATRLNSPETQERLGTDEDYAFGATGDTTAGAPFLAISTRALSDQDALELLSEVETVAAEELSEMQAELNIPAESVISIMTVTTDLEATAVTSTRMQLTVASIGAGVVLTIAIAAAVDGLVAARTRRRAAASTPAARERGRREPLLARDVLSQELPSSRDADPASGSDTAGEADGPKAASTDATRHVSKPKRSTHASANSPARR